MVYPLIIRLDLREFVDTWNQTAESKAAATAEVIATPAGQYDWGLAPVLVALGSVATGVATSAIYDLIKLVLARRNVKQETILNEIPLPGGDRLLVVKAKTEKQS
jgi:hypothetical protein